MVDLTSSLVENSSHLLEGGNLLTIHNLGYVVVLIVILVIGKLFFNGGTYKIPAGTSLVGKYAVVTGGNSGIGAYTVRQLASLGCKIIMGARNRQTAEAVIKDIKKSYPESSVDFIELELNNRESIKSFAESIPFPRIDFLVNNAAVMMIPQKKLTREGVQMQWGVNHLGHFYLTSLLWDKISKSEFFRIINVSSLAHKRPAMRALLLDFENINFQTQYDQAISYGRSKLYNVLFTRALAERMKKGKGLTASLHPGVVRTELMRQKLSDGIKGKIFGLILTAIWPIFCFFTKNAEQGSYTTLFTLLSSQVQNGCYYADCKKSTENPLAIKQNWDRLWEISQKTLGMKFVV